MDFIYLYEIKPLAIALSGVGRGVAGEETMGVI
jgi:hypothetical protein